MRAANGFSDPLINAVGSAARAVGTFTPRLASQPNRSRTGAPSSNPLLCDTTMMSPDQCRLVLSGRTWAIERIKAYFTSREHNCFRPPLAPRQVLAQHRGNGRQPLARDAKTILASPVRELV